MGKLSLGITYLLLLTCSLGAVSRERLFDRLFGLQGANSHRESISGSGSSLEQTRQIRELLPKLLKKYSCTSLLDAPCGDLNWIQGIELPIQKYIGVDIIRSLIARHKMRFLGPQYQFQQLDMVIDSLPQADCILCRDALVHLSFWEIKAVLKNFKRSGAKYLLTTNFMWRETNWDIPTGAWRPLNLTRAPFFFPQPLEVLYEGCTEGYGSFADKALVLWALSDIEIK